MSQPHVLSQALALFFPIHKDGYKFVAIAVAATIAVFLISGTLGLLGTIATLGLIFFFRDPQRMVPQGDGFAVAPADGTVISIEPAVPPLELGLGSDPKTRVSIFLSIFDVHVIRSPVSGRIATSFYRPGQHLNAAALQAPADNECHGFNIETKDAGHIGVILVAGTVARRIVTSTGTGDSVTAGERIGIIRFGSRTDIYLPSSTSLLVAEGQRTVAGETIIAGLEAREPSRQFRRI